MELPDHDQERAQRRQALLEELEADRQAAGDAGAHLFGEPRLERFLVGNDNSISEAAAHFRRMLLWRDQNDMANKRKLVQGKPWSVDSIPGLRRLFEFMSADATGYTKEGHLIWVQCDGRARLDRIGEFSDEELFNMIFSMMELRQIHLDELSEKHGYLCKVIQIRDLSGLSIANVLRDRQTMGRLKKVITNVNVSFPENVHKILLMNLPTGFNLLWNVFQPLLNPIVRRKFIFTTPCTHVSELVALAGPPSLEALVRARQMQLPPNTSMLNIAAGMTEYACCRAKRGDVADWRFNAAIGNGLHFSVSFFSLDPAYTGQQEVESVLDVPEAVKGDFAVDAPGLMWFTWANTGIWRGQKIDALQVRSGPAVSSSNARRDSRTDIAASNSGAAECLDCFGCLAFRRSRTKAKSPLISTQSSTDATRLELPSRTQSQRLLKSVELHKSRDLFPCSGSRLGVLILVVVLWMLYYVSFRT